MKLYELKDLFQCELSGNGEVEITGAAGLSEAGEGDITFLSDRKLLKELVGSKATAVIVKEFVEGLQKPQVKTGNPQYAYAKLLSHFYVKPQPYRGLSRKAFISESASLGENVSVYAFAYISDNARIGPGSVIYPGVFVGEGSSIGEGCLIYPNVTIREGVSIGNRVIIHPGAVIGADGFGYVFAEGAHRKIPQVGGVIIEDDVEIGANTTIDRATTSNTVIGRGTKIDNLVQIAHNVQVGSNVIFVAQIGIGGSTRIGDGVIIGGQSAIADHTNIEAGTMMAARSGALGEVKRGVYSGTPIQPHRDWLRSSVIFAKLPEMKKKLEELEKKIQSLEEKK